MVNTILSLILLRVPSVYLMAAYFGPMYMYYGFGVGWAVGFAATVAYYLSGRWLRHGSLAEEKQQE